MNVKSGLEIVRIHKEYVDKINELNIAAHKLEEFSYTKTVLKDELGKLTAELQALENTRFQALDPVVITTSLLGGR
jgi:predicted nuclease with TOPRIM domain